MADLSATVGDTLVYDIAVKSATGAAYNIAGCALAFTAKADPNQSDSEAFFKLTTESGIVVVSESSGTAQATVSSSVSAAATPGSSYYYDVQLTDADSRIFTVDRGTITFNAQITKI